MERTEARVSRLILVDGHETQYLELSERSDAISKRSLTMAIGRNAAVEITQCLKEESSARPMTHELAHSLVEKLAGHIKETVIHELDQGTYFAELRIERDGDVFGIDCRPSDAIALSLRGSAPIYITEKVWNQVAAG
ncbi:MAG: bifunctional nuclease family protein [Planctomycetota bacterium]|jgi:bifunctional DNase/RNase